MASATNNSVDRALGLLRTLARARRPVRFAELQAVSGIPKGTLHSLLASLEASDFIRRTTEGYEIGVAAFEVGTAVSAPASLRGAAAPLLDELQPLGEACHLGMLDGGDVLYLDRRDYAQEALRYTVRIGSRKPAYATALGKAMLACKSDAELKSLYPAPLTAVTPRTIASLAELLVVIDRIRSSNYATESEESTPGVCCIGVAGRTGELIYGMSFTVPVVRMQEADLAPKFLPVLSAVLSRLGTSLTMAEWFEPGVLSSPPPGAAAM
jgi:DNA-binding IclR family transcriptional regulator